MVILVLPMAGCGTSEEQIQTAIAQTEAANPTATDLVIPTSTLTPTPTVTLTPTDTTTPTLTPTDKPTPTATPDLRVIIIEPRHFQLEARDLPSEGRYYMPSGGMSPHLNSEIISGWGVEEGKAYLAETGRVSGYWSEFYRGTSTVQMPAEASCNIVQYKNSEGAELLITKYSRLFGGIREDGINWIKSNVDMDLGDINEAFYEKWTLSGGEVAVDYRINVVFRNYVFACYGIGYESDVAHEFVENQTRAVLEKLEAAQLVSPEEAEAYFAQLK